MRALTLAPRAWCARIGCVAATIRYARSGDVNIAYQVTGEGAFDLVLVSGFVSHLDNDWQHPASVRLLERLGSFARLIRFDKRGTGLSDRAVGLPDFETRIDDVRAVMDAADSDRAALFGYSEGGPLSVLFAATYPQRVRALALYGTYAKRTGPDSDYPWCETAEQRADYAAAIEREWGVDADLTRMAPSADESFARWWMARARAAASPGSARDLVVMNSQADIRDVLPAVQAPTPSGSPTTSSTRSRSFSRACVLRASATVCSRRCFSPISSARPSVSARSAIVHGRSCSGATISWCDASSSGSAAKRSIPPATAFSSCSMDQLEQFVARSRSATVSPSSASTCARVFTPERWSGRAVVSRAGSRCTSVQGSRRQDPPARFWCRRPPATSSPGQASRLRTGAKSS